MNNISRSEIQIAESQGPDPFMTTSVYQDTCERLVEFYAQRLPNNETAFKQRLVSHSVNAIVDLHHARQDGQMELADVVEKIKCLQTVIRPNFTSGEWRGTEQGILGEVCARLAFEELGFSTYPPTDEEDIEGGIDFTVSGKLANERTVHFAVQVKTITKAKEPDVYNLSHEPEIHATQKVIAWKYTDKMTGYLSRKGSTALPLLVIVPGGMHNDKVGYNITNGRPTETFVQELWAKLEPIVAGAEEK